MRRKYPTKSQYLGRYFDNLVARDVWEKFKVALETEETEESLLLVFTSPDDNALKNAILYVSQNFTKGVDKFNLEMFMWKNHPIIERGHHKRKLYIEDHKYLDYKSVNAPAIQPDFLRVYRWT